MRLDIVIPTYNEAKVIAGSIKTLRNFLVQNMSAYDYRIIIADNGSNDDTTKIAKKMMGGINNLSCNHIQQAGRGGALRHTWQNSSADILAYMDADLATDLKDLPSLVKAVENGADIAYGSRFLSTSKVERSPFRDVLSKYYNILLKSFLGVKFTDGQCGFKSINQKIVKNILPRIKDNHWFFDTEMLYLAEKAGYKIKEIPVNWAETRNKYRKSKVKIIPTVCGYLWLIFKLRLRKI